MAWPNPPDFNEAIQNPRQSFSDPELQQGQPTLNPLGIPWPRSGNNADVYQLECANRQTWAVKCFTREVRGLQKRYQAISEHLRKTSLPCMVDFQYQDKGILVHGQWYPLVKMRWIDGLTLNEFLQECLDQPHFVDRLSQVWLRLAPEMRAARITHGDLQHGNVLLIPGSRGASLLLRLIDYDGLFVPALAQRQSGERGHPNYQHPQRLREGTYHADMDRFSHLVIYTALRSVIRGGESLWKRFDNGENLLFREQDFQKPGRAPIWRALLEMDDPAVRDLAGHLLLASQGPVAKVPLLEELVVEGQVWSLTAGERDKVKAILNGEDAGSRKVPVSAPAAESAKIAPTSAAADTDEPEAIDLEAAQPPLVTHLLGVPLPAVLHRSPQTYWAASLGAGGLLLVAFLTGLFSGLFGSWSVQGQDPIENATSSLLPQIQPLPGVTVRAGGQQVIAVRVERRGYHGPITLRMEGLPAWVTAPPIIIPVQQQVGEIRLIASPDAPPIIQQAWCVALAGERQADQKAVLLTVQKLAQVQLHPPAEVAVFPGHAYRIPIKVERNGYQGTVALWLGSLANGLSQQPTAIAGNQDVGSIEISIAPDTVDAAHTVQVHAKFGDQEETRSMVVRVHKTPVLTTANVLLLKSGEKSVLEVAVDRRGFTGPLQFRVEGYSEKQLSARRKAVWLWQVQLPELCSTYFVSFTLAPSPEGWQRHTCPLRTRAVYFDSSTQSKVRRMRSG